MSHGWLRRPTDSGSCTAGLEQVTGGLERPAWSVKEGQGSMLIEPEGRSDAAGGLLWWGG